MTGTVVRPPAPPAVADVLVLARALRPRIVEQVRTIPDVQARVPGLTWNAGDVAAHMAAGTEVYVDIVRGKGSTYTELETPAITAMNGAGVASIGDRRPQALAERLDAAFGDLIAELGRPDPPATVEWHAGVAMSPASVGAALVGDLTIHGHDLARARRGKWAIDPALVDVLLPALAPIMPRFVDAKATAQMAATFAITLRGHGTWYLRIDHGVLSVGTGWDGPVACRINADPATYLLALYGRVGKVGPALRGQILVYGRQPWLGLKVDRLVVAP